VRLFASLSDGGGRKGEWKWGEGAMVGLRNLHLEVAADEESARHDGRGLGEWFGCVERVENILAKK
jgi:hypothetical protein